MDENEKEIQQEIFTYTSNGLIYSANWSIRPDRPYRLAFGSFVGTGPNYIEVLQLNKERTNFVRVGGAEHAYPPTKLAWIPDRTGSLSDILATTSDYLRLYNVETGGNIKLRSVLTGVRVELTLL
jgi:WD repeat-containing protein 68